MGEPSENAKWEGGEVVFTGGTDWAMLGRSGGKGKADAQAELERQEKYPNLPKPTRLKSLMGIKVAFIASGSAAVHCIIGDTAGNCYTWGRNEKGQLGHGDQLQRNVPTIVKGLQGKFVTGACGGRHHTVVVTNEGESYTWGLNTQGQCGIGSIKKNKNVTEDLQLSPVRALVEDVSAVSAGLDFTVWLCKGQVWSAGYPLYGQLGDGSDHMYNAKDTGFKIMYDPQPTPKLISGLSGHNIVKIACGHNHTIALDDKGAAFTWGNGNYGKLGHKVQQDEKVPRMVEAFKGRMMVIPEGVACAGSTSTFCTATGNQLYGWGKLKVSGDNNTHPVPVYDLQGWNIHSMACGPATFAVAADKSVITWGAATNGELGYGPEGKKSSANPAKCDTLDNMYTHQVACGMGFTLMLVEPNEERLSSLEVFEPSVEMEEAIVVEEGGPAGAKGGAKGKAGGAAAGGKRKAPAAGGRGKKAK